jgi:poly-gamma-glutamate capsule biosynthesis protein CapA/YwtB (metallophosphatase superfamily)
LSTDGLVAAVLGQALIKRDIRSVPAPGLDEVKALLAGADLVLSNLEATISVGGAGWPTKSRAFGAAPPTVLDALREIGINALALANNHAFDLGPGGILATLEEVSRRSFLHAGIGVDLAAAARPGFRKFGKTRVALVAMNVDPAGEQVYAQDATPRIPARPGVNPQRVAARFVLPPEDFARLCAIEDVMGHRRVGPDYRRAAPSLCGEELDFYGLRFTGGEGPRREGVPDAADRARNLAAIATAAAQADLVIAYLHHHLWEPRWEITPDWARGFARDCIDAGAHLYLSHGTPLLQGIELHRGRPMLHGLGNFIFQSADASQWVHPGARQSVVARCRFAPGGALASLTLHPIVIEGENATPRPALAPESRAILANLADLSVPLGTQFQEGGAAVLV